MTNANNGPKTALDPSDGVTSSRPSALAWLTAGFAVWLIATLVLGWIGDLFLERGMVVYIVFVIAVCLGFVALFAFLARLAKLARPALLQAAVAFSIAGMAGEVIVMMTFPMFVPALSASTAGPFAAFLFCGYAALLSYALSRSR